VHNQRSALLDREAKLLIRRNRSPGAARGAPLLDTRFVRAELARLATPRRRSRPHGKRERQA
jgi:hypothetical protein